MLSHCVANGVSACDELLTAGDGGDDRVTAGSAGDERRATNGGRRGAVTAGAAGGLRVNAQNGNGGARALRSTDRGAAELAALVARQLDLIGEDAQREGLLRTPARVATALRWLTRGYDLEVADVVGNAVFHESHENMVLVRDLELYSLCEHHMLPFFGKAHVAYIPNGRILGLSKIPRVIDVFARRLQVQERLTEQIADAFMDVLEPRGVGVVIEAQHLCMMMRGVEKQNSSTVTSALRGVFRDCAMTREEFLRLAHRR